MSSEFKKDEGEYQAMQDRSIETESDTDVLAKCDTVQDMLARYDAVPSNAEETED